MNCRLICLCLTFLASAVSLSQTRRALVIGIGEQKDTSWDKINGDKDVPFVLKMLKNAGYNKRNIITLVNGQATKEGIVDAFGRLTKSCEADDIIYIHFSGHGQRVSDIDGDELDGWDESWIPYDGYRKYCALDRGEKHLIDDEIFNYLNRIKNKSGKSGRILVVVDACHSGDSSKSVSQEKSESAMRRKRRGASEPFVIPHNTVTKVKKAQGQWLTLSACKSFQANQELDNPEVGILSYALYTISKEGSVEMWKIEDFIEKHKGPYPQTPVLTGEVDNYKISDILK